LCPKKEVFGDLDEKLDCSHEKLGRSTGQPANHAQNCHLGTQQTELKLQGLPEEVK
jgi:hypothetical protein